MPEEPTIREWTVMFSFASDNPLAPGTISQLKAIKNAGYHREVNVIAQFDPHTINTPVHIFDVNSIEKLVDPKLHNIGFASDNPSVRNLVLDKLWDADVKTALQGQLTNNGSSNQNRANPQRPINYDPPVPTRIMSSEQNPRDSLASFIEFCRINYPARHYILILLGHGVVVGNDLFMVDEHTDDLESPQHSLKLTDLGEVLGKFSERIKGDGELELIGFHSCSMSAAEVAFELKEKANYMLASEGPAFVGSWPYRQILIRLFNEVAESETKSKPLDTHLIAGGLVDRVKTGVDDPATHIRRGFNGKGAELLKKYEVGCSPDSRLVEALAQKLENLINNSTLGDVKAFQNGNSTLSKKTRNLLGKHKKLAEQGQALQGDDKRELNRRLILDAFPDEIKQIRNRRMFIQFFDYCSYNSFDFQLAGYSSDLTLCDLNRVHQLEEPLEKLAKTLSESLKHEELEKEKPGKAKRAKGKAKRATDSSIIEAVLLAHWEAQSYYEENYIDLYDFCFRLAAKCKIGPESQKTAPMMKEIAVACDKVMEVLKRGFSGNDFGSIVRCEFSGPTYQFSHGLSIFLPWSEPVGNRMWDNEYEQYDLHQGTKWRDFLKTYFDVTMRSTQEDERKDDKHERAQQKGRERLDRQLLQIVEHMAAQAFSDVEQISGGSRDVLGGTGRKSGGTDPTGGGCECNSIKNHPRITRRQPILIVGKNGTGDRTVRFVSPASDTIIEELRDQFIGASQQGQIV